MSTTPNLLISHIASSQNNKEVTANTAFDDLDVALTDILSMAQGDATLTLTSAQALQHMVFVFTGALTGARNVIVPAGKKLYVVSNQTSGGFAITVKTPSGTGIVLSTSRYVLLYCDGVNVVSLAARFVGDAPLSLGKYTVANLPSGSEGQVAYATDGCKVGESTGFGSGVPVYWSSVGYGGWHVFSTDTLVTA